MQVDVALVDRTLDGGGASQQRRSIIRHGSAFHPTQHSNRFNIHSWEITRIVNHRLGDDEDLFRISRINETKKRALRRIDDDVERIESSEDDGPSVGRGRHTAIGDAILLQERAQARRPHVDPTDAAHRARSRSFIADVFDDT